MMPTRGRTVAQSWLALVPIALVASLTAPTARAAPSRPPPAAACQAMQVHIAELIDQHRRADELDDVSFGRVIQLFYEAQIACTGERYEEGLATYSVIPIGRLTRAPLR